LIFGSVTAYLDPGRVKWSVLVLERADQNNVLEPFESLDLAQFVERGLLNVLAVGHLQLIENYRLLPHFEEGHASGE
jgi:hypothetical protein